MTEQTQQNLRNTLSLLNQYANQKNSLRLVVNKLEETLPALEKELPEDFIYGWRQHWGELEIILSLDREKKQKAKVLEEIYALQEIILKQFK